MFDLGIFFGHGEGDTGAIANGYKEVDLVENLVGILIKILDKNGLKVDTNYFTKLNNYSKILTKDKKYKYNLAITFHCNSANSNEANGTEIFVPLNEKYFRLENDLLKTMERYGFYDRGVKSRNYDTGEIIYRVENVKISGKDYYKEIRESWSNNISHDIFELFFLNNKNDLDKYLKYKESIIEAIANDILNYCNVKNVENEDKKYYRVVVGSYTIKENAEQQQKELKDKYNMDSFIDFR